MVRNKKPEAERASQNQEYQENKRSEAEERTKDACSPQKQLFSLLSSCPPHQLTQPTADQSDAVLHNFYGWGRKAAGTNNCHRTTADRWALVP